MLEMVKRVKDVNKGDPDNIGSVPLSDTCYQKVFSDLCDSSSTMAYYLRILVDSHYLLAITYVEDDSNMKDEGLEGYVISEPKIIEALLATSSLELEAAYEHQFYKRNSVNTIIRELLPQARLYNNLPIGRVLNTTVMLQQFLKILNVEADQYNGVWKRSKLNKLLEESGLEKSKDASDELLEDDQSEKNKSESEILVSFDDEDENVTSSKPINETKEPKRAVDTDELENIQKMNQSGQWGLAVKKYGTQFLIRVHLRKYEFDKIKWLLRTKKIAREEDLKFIRESIRVMEDRYEIDTQLNRFRKEMSEVKRLVQIRLNAIFNLKNGNTSN